MRINNKHHGKNRPHGNNRPRPSQPQQDNFRKTKPEPAPTLKHKDLIAKTRPAYYDEARDARERERYYARIQPSDSPKDFYYDLSELVTDTHENKRGYNPDELLYPWVDLRPSMRLQSLYSDQEVKPGSPLHTTAETDYLGELNQSKPSAQRLEQLQRQAEQWVHALEQGPTDAVNIAMRLAEVETRSYYNCEHVVPRIWFGDDHVPEGDLHHLFACEKVINAERSSLRLKEVEDPTETFPEGTKKVGEFEPTAGKGPAARATLYFLLRYPGKIGDHKYEYTADDIQTLVRWSNENPVTLHEHHRNQAIADIQGNRNPFIDHPEWVDKVDFTRGLGHVRPELPTTPRTGSHGPVKSRF